MRLAAQSRISSSSDGPGHVMIVEELKGKAEAILALAFGCFVLIVITLVGLAEFRRSDPFFFILIVVGPGLALVGTMVMVIDQTWRKTLIEVRDGRLELRFRSVFLRAMFAWPTSEMTLMVVVTQPQAEGPVLAELHIQPVDAPLVRLLTDHAIAQVEEVSDLLQTAIAATRNALDAPARTARA